MSRTEPIDIPTRDGVADAQLVLPDGTPRGGLLLLMDAFGLRPRIVEMAERIAAEGYVVLAPNLFYRAGRAPVVELGDMSNREALFERIRPLMATLGPENVISDGRAYLDALAERVPGALAVTGYCFGARLGMRLAAAYADRVVALGGFHGGQLVTDDPDSPHRLAGQIRAELYFGHADNDHSNSPEQIAALDAALGEAGVRHRSEVYAGAAHGYTMSDTPAYDEAACERHFAALFDLLGRTLA